MVNLPVLTGAFGLPTNVACCWLALAVELALIKAIAIVNSAALAMSLMEYRYLGYLQDVVLSRTFHYAQL